MFFSRNKDKASPQKTNVPVSEDIDQDWTTKALHALSSIQDPDLGKDIVTLGFIKNLKKKDTHVSLTLELTTPACPVKEELKAQVENVLLGFDWVEKVDVELTAQTLTRKVSTPSTEKSLGKVKNIIAVASGKGGVGKSTTTVNLAYALKRLGAKVGIMDADVYGPSVQIMTQVENPSRYNDGLIVPPRVGGIPVMSVAMFSQGDKAAILRGPMASQLIKQFLSQVEWGELDYLLIDYPPGTGDIQLSLSQMVTLTGAVIVSTPQKVALADVKKAMGMFETLKVPILGFVENMSTFKCGNCETEHRIFGHSMLDDYIAEKKGSLLGSLPLDPQIMQGADVGKPIGGLEKSKTSDSLAEKYEAIAQTLAQAISIQHASENQKGRLERFSLKWQRAT